LTKVFWYYNFDGDWCQWMLLQRLACHYNLDIEVWSFELAITSWVITSRAQNACDDTRVQAMEVLRAMTAPAAPADVKDNLLLQSRRLLDKSKPELQKEWKEVDCSDFEPVAKADLLAALLCRLLRGASDLDSAQSQPSSSISPVVSPTNTPTPAKSFTEAVASPARSFDCNKAGRSRALAQGTQAKVSGVGPKG